LNQISSNRQLLAIPILVVPMLNAKLKTELLIVFARQAMSVIHTALVDQNAF
jgi:hypothetical protein